MCSLLVIFSLGVIHCSDLGTTTILDPEGAPEIKQVFVEERVSCTPRGKKQRSQMAFGSHPDIPYPTKDSDGNYEDLCEHIDTQFVDDRVVTNAIASSAQKIRVVMSELLEGTNLEVIRCYDGSLSEIPLGMTPDELAACTRVPPLNPNPDESADDITQRLAAEVDAVTESCAYAAEICTIPGTSNTVGVLDSNGDGAADEFCFKTRGELPPATGIHGSTGLGAPTVPTGDPVVRVVCDGDVMPLRLCTGWSPLGQEPRPTNSSASFWNPSGNQLIPAGSIGLDGLGPAIVLRPEGLKTGSTCTIEFDDTIVDKDGKKVCAKDESSSESAACDEPHDVISFKVEAFELIGSTPRDGLDNVSADFEEALFQFNQAVDPACVSDGLVELTTDSPSDGVLLPDWEVSVNPDGNPAILLIAFEENPNGSRFSYETNYSITVKESLCEPYGGTLKEDLVVSFTTKPAP